MKKQGVLILLILSLSGCAHTVMLDTYTAPQLAGRVLPPGTVFQVLENASVPNPVFDRSVKEKLERLLQASGFKTGSAAPDYVIDYAYEMAGHTESRVYPRTQTAHYSFLASDGRTAVLEPMFYTTYVEETYPVFTAKLRLRILTPASNGKSQQDRALWVGEFWTDNEEPDMRESINYLAVTGIRMLGKDSLRPKNVSLKNDDPLLAALRHPKVDISLPTG